jgi:hypothetical protein
MFQHCNVHKYTRTSDVKTHSQSDQVLIYKRQHYVINIIDVRPYRGAVRDTDRYLVAEKFREGLSV